MPYTQVANLDYTQIKQALKDYLKSTSDFSGYDFEGSALSTLLDVLAYNTYYTAFNTNMVVNELFLDSATLRDNVVRIARQLGYIPKSITAPTAKINFQVNFQTPSQAPSLITLKEGTGFTSQYDDTLFRFVTLSDYTVPVNSGIANFYNIELREGNYVTNNFTVDTSLTNQRYVLDNKGIDANTIKVKVFPSETSSSFELYNLESDILSLTPTSKVFLIEEVEDERYEIIFGDGVFGRKLQDGELVQVSYLTTSGSASNQAGTFVFGGVLSDITGNTNYIINVNNIQVLQKADGGVDIENIKKIKFNAPRFFATQNRAVTAADYAAIVRNLYPSVADIITYGGEEEDPPQYGKVFVVIKPTEAAYLTSFTKNQIIELLKPYMVASVTPELKDPSILYVEITSKIYYDRSVTTLLPAQITNKVTDSINQYIESSKTEKFNGKFRYSKYVAVVDDADRSISSNITTVMMRKDFYPQLNSASYYEICFQNEFDVDCETNTIQSSGFVVSQYPEYTVYFEDRDGKVVLYRLDSVTGEKIVVNADIGMVDYAKGEVKIDSLTIIKGSFIDNRIQLRAVPRSNDIFAKREVYLDVDIQNSKFTAYQE